MNLNGVSTLPSTENWESEFAELDNVRFELDLHPSARNRNRARFAPSGINGNRARLWECAGDSSSQRMSSLKRKYRARWRKIELEKDFVLERPKSSSVAQKQKLIQTEYGFCILYNRARLICKPKPSTVSVFCITVNGYVITPNRGPITATPVRFIKRSRFSYPKFG